MASSHKRNGKNSGRQNQYGHDGTLSDDPLKRRHTGKSKFDLLPLELESLNNSILENNYIILLKVWFECLHRNGSRIGVLVEVNYKRTSSLGQDNFGLLQRTLQYRSTHAKPYLKRREVRLTYC